MGDGSPMWREGSRALKGSSSRPLGLGVPEADDSNDHNSYHEDKPGRCRAHNEGELLLELLGTRA